MTLVLASGSPRRLDLLRAGGLEPVVVPADVDESARPGERAPELVRRLAATKATAVDGAIVLGADTVVALDGAVLGKPADADEAGAMLTALSGRTATVWSGVAVAAPDAVRHRVVGSLLRFHQLDEARIAAYLATGEPFGVAGAFRIQGRGRALVAARTGCWTNVVGLPTCQAAALLAPAGVALRPDDCRPATPATT